MKAIKNKKEAEKRIIAELEEAMEEKNKETQAEEVLADSKTASVEQGSLSIHCRKCRTLMENGVCPKCGHTVYVPMDKKKRERIRWIVGGTCILVFLILLLLTK